VTEQPKPHELSMYQLRS